MQVVDPGIGIPAPMDANPVRSFGVAEASTTRWTVDGAVRMRPWANPAVPNAHAAPVPTLNSAAVASHHQPVRPGTVR